MFDTLSNSLTDTRCELLGEKTEEKSGMNKEERKILHSETKVLNKMIFLLHVSSRWRWALMFLGRIHGADDAAALSVSLIKMMTFPQRKTWLCLRHSGRLGIKWQQREKNTGQWRRWCHETKSKGKDVINNCAYLPMSKWKGTWAKPWSVSTLFCVIPNTLRQPPSTTNWLYTCCRRQESRLHQVSQIIQEASLQTLYFLKTASFSKALLLNQNA